MAKKIKNISLISNKKPSKSTIRITETTKLNELDQKLPGDLSVGDIKRHFESAALLKEIVTEREPANLELKIPGKFKDWRTKYTGLKLIFDAEKFGNNIRDKLAGKVAGYCIQVRINSRIVYSYRWNWAQTPADNKKGWLEDTRMHIASLSKFITAVGLVKVLEQNGISYDEKINNFLPSYWDIHDDIVNNKKLTFRNLLTHTSGFYTCDSSQDYAVMKAKLNSCIPYHSQSNYCNMNFGLMRILIPIIAGTISKDLYLDMPSLFPFPNDFMNWLNRDTLWDFLAIQRYREYILNNVFIPSGVNYAILDSDFSRYRNYPANQLQNKAFAYLPDDNGKKGFDSGNLATAAGGAGWRLSVEGLLNILGTVRRKNTIISSRKAKEMFDNSFGIFPFDTPQGKAYVHNGWWENGEKKVEQTVQFFFPRKMEVVAFANSSINGNNLQGVIQDAYMTSFSIPTIS